MMFRRSPVMTPGLARSFRISVVTSFGDFLSIFLAMGKGSVEISAFMNPGIESNSELS